MSPAELKAHMEKAVQQGRSQGVDAGKTGEDGKPKKKTVEDSSLKIRIELNLDVEIHLTARVQGDITIGLL